MQTPSALVVDEDEARRAARALAAELSSLGCRAGARVAVYAGNSAGWVAARDAATDLDLVLVPVNPRLAPPEVAYVLGHSRAQVLLVDPALAADAERACAALEPRPQVVDLAQATAGRAAPGRAGSRAFGATLIYTSGTTGEPKGCMRTAAQEEARGHELIATYGIDASDVHLIACPLAHSAPGIFLRAGRAAGARTLILPRFRPEAFLEAVARHRATVFFLVPTQYERLLALPPEVRRRYDLSSVRAAIVAGAPIAPATKVRLVEWLGEGRLWEFYGSSETGTVTVLPPEEQLARPGSVGRPPSGVAVQLVPLEAGDRMAAGADHDDAEVGEIFVRSPAVMSGYYAPEREELVRPSERDGFISVGDLGRVDLDGYLYLVDRKHDTIITGGVNVYPAEVERALGSHPDVAGAVAFGVDDPEWGQIVAAVVAPRPGRTVDPAQLRGYLRQQVAPYKIPKALALAALEELPLGSSGKPLRRMAREQFAAALRRYDR